MQIAAWTESITTGAVGCELKFAVTLPAISTDGPALERPSRIDFGQNSISPLTFLPARNTSPPTQPTHSLATTVSLHGTPLFFKRWSWQACGSQKWILTISQSDFP